MDDTPSTPIDQAGGMSGETNELFSALSKAQGKFKPVKAARVGQHGHRKFKYADLDCYIDAVRDPLAENELSSMFVMLPTDGTKVHVRMVLGHSSGQWISSEVVLLAGGTDLQAMGKASSYARRYLFSSMLSLAASEDDAEQEEKPKVTSPARMSTGSRTKPTNGANPDVIDEIKDTARRLGMSNERLKQAIVKRGAAKLAELKPEALAELRESLNALYLKKSADAAF